MFRIVETKKGKIRNKSRTSNTNRTAVVVALDNFLITEAGAVGNLCTRNQNIPWNGNPC